MISQASHGLVRGSLARSCESSTPVENQGSELKSKAQLNFVELFNSPSNKIGPGWIMLINIYHQGYSSITTLPSSKRPRKLLAVPFPSLGHSILKDHARILAVGNLGILPETADPNARNCSHLPVSKGRGFCAWQKPNVSQLGQLQGPVGDCYRLVAW